VRFSKIIAQTNKDRHILRKSSAGTLVCGNIRFVQILAPILYKKRRQRTVGSCINAHLELLFFAFENNCIKVNTDTPTIAAVMQFRDS